MSFDNNLIYRSGDLTIQPQLGEIKNNQGDSVRLGPINMKVLVHLLEHPGKVISRSELFDNIWKNQVVNDDTLTRCISDIRAYLSQLSVNNHYIETLPKRGYRWTKDVIKKDRVVPLDNSDCEPDQHKIIEPSTTTEVTDTSYKKAISWFAVMNQGIAYIVAFLVIASFGAWLLNQLADTDQFRIAVLPTQSSAELSESALLFNDQLMEAFIQLDQIDVLSKSAVDSRPSNPFPYFFYEFGARWVLESELNHSGNSINHVISLVDARTGIVIIRQNFETTENTVKKKDNDTFVQEFQKSISEIKNFLESEVRI